MRHREYRGKTALVYYRGGAAGEEIVEDHSPAVQSEPERILLGSGEVPLGVSDVLYDMEVGEERRAVIPCDRAFGRHDPEGVQRYARMLVPGGDRLEAGVVFAWRHPVTGASVPVKCVEATKDAVVVDFNHLLAGKDLEYWFKLVDVVDDAGVSVTGWQAMCYPCTFCGALWQVRKRPVRSFAATCHDLPCLQDRVRSVASTMPCLRNGPARSGRKKKRQREETVMCFRPAAVEIKKTCSECGAENEPTASTCEQCGAELPASAFPPAPGAPGAPSVPGKPGAPSAPGVPGMSSAPKAPGAPSAPGAPGTPEA